MLDILQQRRQALLAQMVDNSAAIIFAAGEKVRSADTHYLYRQDSDFWYLTQFNEPQAALVLIKSNDQSSKIVLFNRLKDLTAEIWHGRRLGQDAAPAKLGVDYALPFDDIERELPQLLSQVKQVYHARGLYDYADQIVFAALDAQHQGRGLNYHAPNLLSDWRPLLHEMRLFKSPDELAIMRQAAEITAKAHCRAMEKCHPGMYEYQLEAEILHEFARFGARSPSYNTIVGGGENGCILHYVENDQPLRDGDLVLIDAGCEYQGYAGDITRTFPINGRFTQAQREIYQIVLKAQYKALEMLVPGNSIKQANNQVIRIMVEGLCQLGILQGDTETLIANGAHRQFYMHGLGHWLGLDVHDVGDYLSTARERILQPNMVLTVEPGLYIALDADVAPQYRGIGIRIEDDILITAHGNEVLTALVPKEIDAIETLMAQSCQ